MSFLASLVALLKAVPALENILRMAIAERDKQNEAEAIARKQAKDQAVDDAIDHPTSS